MQPALIKQMRFILRIIFINIKMSGNLKKTNFACALFLSTNMHFV